ncbi:MAG: hypothetical protein GY807_11400 [Gammaproteobacteria bacterium]|nr:hypothetical protein [Gammaproteobacteria bacterium]
MALSKPIVYAIAKQVFLSNLAAVSNVGYRPEGDTHLGRSDYFWLEQQLPGGTLTH